MENETMTKKEMEVETKLCKHCQSEIPKKAKVCPNCRKKQGGKGKWIVIIVVVLFIFAAASGGDESSTANKVGETQVSETQVSETQVSETQVNETQVSETQVNETQVNETSTTENPVNTETQAETDETGTVEQEESTDVEQVDNEFHVGDVVETSTLKISYLSAQEYISDNQFIQPKEGHVFYRMEFEFENISDSDQMVSGYLLECYADGYAADQSYIGDDQISATLSKGKKAKGAVYYEVPADAQEIVLEYETNFWTENKVIFVVK